MGKPETNLHVDAELLAQAQAAGVSVEAVAESAIRQALAKADPAAAEERARKWAEENAEAIKDYNRRIRERGLISDEFRKW
ncbi:MAG TPA: type II toxin-antitoxin system CcdA family antitoxin [Phenylobacterium sp.]|jgi:antitoxin CcdA|uniref:type II toxin-antitoxin system CcdA family antitoxin n=1 Tax=Phenylobacterium sp. TaxID=1871053 RepID=UPI002D739AE9|nr:type II toxin-antitoxin system CcdA family antitoxin [Phenylobacterium sp.]HZZ68257.1 type II toxin-antitoxin system CcdA family antitoxin [Phenylobacterium sp.]